MAIGIDEIDEQDEELTSQEEEESSQEPESQPYQQTDIIDELLKDRGIEDRSKIKFESEDGVIFTKWYSTMCRLGIPIEWEDMI